MNSAGAGPRDWPRMLVAVSTLAGWLASAVLLWLTYSGLQMIQWNAPRLAAGWALAHGLNIYGTAHDGPFLGWIYGPMFPFYTALAAWLPGVTAFFTGAWLLNLLAALVPVAVCLRTAARRETLLPLLTLYLVLLLSSPLTQRSFLFLHVDTLCIGFGLLACCSLSRAASGGGTGAVVMAALFSTLAIGTKQVAVGLPVGLTLWLLTGKRHSLLGRYWFWLLALGGLFWAFCLAGFGAERLVFNLWWYHQHNPWDQVSWTQRGRDGLQLAINAWPWLLGLLVAWRQLPPPDRAGPGGHLRAALLWTALGVLPFGLVAAGRVAGSSNSLHSFSYVFVWLLLRLAGAWPETKLTLQSAAAYAALLLAACVGGGVTAYRAELSWRPSRQAAADLELARQHPGKLYLPWNPLATLMTDGKIYPFDDALLCLARMGARPSAAAVLREVPRGALIVYPDPVQSEFALTYLRPPSAGATAPP